MWLASLFISYVFENEAFRSANVDEAVAVLDEESLLFDEFVDLDDADELDEEDLDVLVDSTDVYVV